MPDRTAVVMPLQGRQKGRRRYTSVTFRQLDEDSNRIASGLISLGVPVGSRLALLVRPSIDFITLVFALLKAGMVTVLIDPGMGRGNLLRCLAQCAPQGLVAIPIAHVARWLFRWRFPEAKHLVTVGRRWFWGGWTLEQIRAAGSPAAIKTSTESDDPAAIIFTTGSTGPPKGVLYRHRNFWGQVDAIRDRFDIQPGAVDLPGFPLFALFNCAMGVATIVPDMDPTRPANVNPQKIIEAVVDWKVTQAFGSPAMWNTVGRYCELHGTKLPTLRRVFSAGAPVPPHVLERMRAAIHPKGEIHTPYGATEALPVASISATEILSETAAKTRAGQGYCVGHRFAGIQWRVIRITDHPIKSIEDAKYLPRGEIGELIVRGDVVTSEYVTGKEANALYKIADPEGAWHRMGDVGYLDERDRFWFCGRKAHRIEIPQGLRYTIPCEAVFNCHPDVYRSALVGIGPRGSQRPVIVVEPWPERYPARAADQRRLIAELLALAQQQPLTAPIRDVLLRRKLPVDVRHNAKIFREQLSVWAARRLRTRQS